MNTIYQHTSEELSPDLEQALKYAKVGIPDYIMQKPDKLNTAEFNTIREHTTIGEKILKGR